MKSNTFKFVIYNTCLILFSMYFIGNQFIMNKVTQVAFFVPLLLLIITLVFYLFLPKEHSNYLKNLLANPIMRVIVFIYLFISSVVFIVATIYIITNFFYRNNPFIEAGIIIAFMIGLICTYSLRNIYNVSVTLFCILFCANLIVLVNTSTRDVLLVSNLNMSFDNTYMVLSLLYLFLDGILFYFYNIDTGKVNIKKGLIISTIISTLITSIIIFNNYTFYVYQYLERVNFPGFAAILNYLGPEFLEHFDLLILLNICVWVLMKSSMNARFAIIITKKKLSPLMMIFIIGITIAAIIFTYRIDSDYMSLVYYTGLFLTGLILIIYGFLIYRKVVLNNEIKKHRQSIKESA